MGNRAFLLRSRVERLCYPAVGRWAGGWQGRTCWVGRGSRGLPVPKSKKRLTLPLTLAVHR